MRFVTLLLACLVALSACDSGETNPPANPPTPPPVTPPPAPPTNPPADTAPPVVALTQPAAGATVSGAVPVRISASDNVGVRTLRVLVDGLTAFTTNSAAATFNWNTVPLSDGPHTLLAQATDAAGNMGQSAVLTVQVDNVPEDPRVFLTSVSLDRAPMYRPDGSYWDDGTGPPDVQIDLESGVAGFSYTTDERPNIPRSNYPVVWSLGSVGIELPFRQNVGVDLYDVDGGSNREFMDRASPSLNLASFAQTRPNVIRLRGSDGLDVRLTVSWR